MVSANCSLSWAAVHAGCVEYRYRTAETLTAQPTCCGQDDSRQGLIGVVREEPDLAGCDLQSDKPDLRD